MVVLLHVADLGHEVVKGDVLRLVSATPSGSKGAVSNLAVANDDGDVSAELEGVDDLLVHGDGGVVDLDGECLGVHHVVDLAGVLDLLLVGHVLRDEDDLARGQPEWELAGVVLNSDGEEALEGAEDSAVDHNWAVWLSLAVDILEVEALWELEVELDGGELMAAAEAVLNEDIDLRTIESGLSWSLLEATAGLDESTTEHIGGLLPDSEIAHVLLHVDGGKGELEFHTEDLIDLAHEVEGIFDLSTDLIAAAEDVGIILDEAADTSETGEGTSGLIAMKNTELSHTDRKLSVRADLAAEDKAVAWAVHRLHGELTLLLGTAWAVGLHGSNFLFGWGAIIDLPVEHILLIVGPVTGGAEEVVVEDVRGDDLEEVALDVLLADHLHEAAVHEAALWIEEGTAWRPLVEEEEAEFETEAAVVALGGFLDELLVLSHLLLLREGDGADAGHAAVSLAVPDAGGGVLNPPELDWLGVDEMWATAEIDEGAGAVESDEFAFLAAVGEDLGLVVVGLEDLEGLLAGAHLALVVGLGLASGQALLFDLLEDLGSDLSVGLWLKVVEEALLASWADGDLDTKEEFDGGTEDVGRGVPEDLLTTSIIEVNKGDAARFVDRAGKIIQLTIKYGSIEGSLREVLLSDVKWCGDTGSDLDLFAFLLIIGAIRGEKGNFDFSWLGTWSLIL